MYILVIYHANLCCFFFLSYLVIIQNLSNKMDENFGDMVWQLSVPSTADPISTSDCPQTGRRRGTPDYTIAHHRIILLNPGPQLELRCECSYTRTILCVLIVAYITVCRFAFHSNTDLNLSSPLYQARQALEERAEEGQAVKWVHVVNAIEDAGRTNDFTCQQWRSWQWNLLW